MSVGTVSNVVSPAIQSGPKRSLVRLQNVSKHFAGIPALRDISLEVQQGEILGIIGRSGAGKSTLIRCLNGLERPDSGSVEVNGIDLTRLPEADLPEVRRQIGMIFQQFNLLSAKTVVENVALPLKIARWPKRDIRHRVSELLELVGLAEKANVYPATLSGGQKQRVGIARALAAEPKLLLSDEATSALDPETTESILTLLKDINRRLGLTIVLITHEMSVIRAIANRVIVLDQGAVEEHGPVWQVFATPQAELTRNLVAAIHSPLPAFLSRALQPTGSLAVINITFLGSETRQPILADLVTHCGVRPTIIHGTVDHIQEQALGHLVIAFEAESLERVREHLQSRISRLEVLGYVNSLD